MKIRYVSLIAATCVLAACQSPATNSPSTQTSAQAQMTQAMHSTPSAQKFECKKGMTATVKYLGNDTISLAVDTIGAEIKLTQAVSGSGERFVNNKGFYNHTTEWHQKGNAGHLSFTDPYGNTVESACSAK